MGKPKFNLSWFDMTDDERDDMLSHIKVLHDLEDDDNMPEDE